MAESKRQHIDKYKFTGTGLDDVEKKWAQKQFKNYKKQYHISSLSDLSLLEELVYRESIQERYKQKIEDISKSKSVKEGNIIPSGVLKSLDENLGQILILKERLGLFKDEKGDEFKAFEILEKKAEIYRKEHMEEFKTTCPFCSEVFFLNIRTDKYVESKLKLYKNKVLCNTGLWKVFKEGKITKVDMAEILNVSEQYIDWLEEHI